MSELKSVYIDRTGDWVRSENDTGKFYIKYEADKVIAELEESHKKEVEQLLLEIVKLKDNLNETREWLIESQKMHQRCADNASKQIRRLKRALWLARAEKARFLAMLIDNHPYTQVLHFTSHKRDESGKPLGVARTAMEWWKMFQEVELKCRAKAEEYK